MVEDSATILIIDDEIDTTFTFENALKHSGFKVDVYNDPLLALSDFKPNLYDLLLIDINMPNMNGFELYRRIKEKNSSLKIAFITAFEINQEEFSKVLPSIDVKDFIIKPIGMSNLKAKLRSMIQKSV